MFLIYIYNPINLDLLILKACHFLNKQKNEYNIIIYSTISKTINNNLTILDEKTIDLFYKKIETFDYEYIIELDADDNLDFLLCYQNNLDNYITCNYNENKNINDYFTIDESNSFAKINKKLQSIKQLNNFPSSIKIYNIHNLKKIDWFNTMQYLHNKCIELNININNDKLLIIYQLLYPQYINLNINKLDYIYSNMWDIFKDTNEIKEDATIIEDTNILENEWTLSYRPDVWLIKRSSCKNLLNNYILTLENTKLKKNCVKDPLFRITFGVYRLV